MKLKRYNYILILFNLLIVSEVNSFSQVKAIVITRNIEKKFAVSEYPAMLINTERGIISVKGWDSSDIKVVLKLVSKNIDPKIARKELEYMTYSITKMRNSVFINNSMTLPQANQEISSVVLAEYEIFVPVKTEIRVNDQFGKLEIENVNGLLAGELQYSDLSLNRKSGNINLIITIGDFNCSKSQVNGIIKTRHSNVSITETSGRLQLETDYGTLRLTFGNEPLRFDIQSNATDIFVGHSKCYPLELDLTGTYCPLKISDNCYTPKKIFLQSNYQPDSDQNEWKLIYLPPDKTTRLKISAKFGTLNLF
jgi:hypothetical protein